MSLLTCLWRRALAVGLMALLAVASAHGAGTNAQLSALSLNIGALSPAFDSATYAYESNFSNNVTTVSLTCNSFA